MRKLILATVLLAAAVPAFPQAWSGIIDPSRATDWTGAGISGGIPSASWTQCGATIAAYTGSAAVINTAISGCGTNQCVVLGTGTFTLSTGMFSSKSNACVRGQGPNSTFIVAASGSTSSGACYGSFFAANGSCWYVNGGEANVCDWAAGYAPGTTIITLANCGTTTPAKGALANLKVGSIIILDQLDETTDTGTIWNCENSGGFTGGICAGTVQGGGSRTNGPCNGTTCDRSQQQGVIVTAINGLNITVSPGIRMPNWRTGQKPQAWFANATMSKFGFENFSFDGSLYGGTSLMEFVDCNGCWSTNIRSIKANRSHLRFTLAVHSMATNNYYFANQGGSSQSYGVELQGAWDNVIANNIFQQITDSDPSCTAACEGNYIGYNFDVNNLYTTSFYIVPPFFQHASGDAYNLWEGNIGPGYAADNIHGTHHFETVYRNTLPGWQLRCFSGTDCRAQTIPIFLSAGSRYLNIIGNNLGQAGYHTTYECPALTTNTQCPQSYQVGGFDKMIYHLAHVNGSYPSINGFCVNFPTCSTFSNYDPQTYNYLFRWVNYDTVNNAIRANSAEVPSTISPYSNAVPTSICTIASLSTCPASFFYPAKPSYFGSLPYPSAGPDITGGNLGQCSGGTYAGMAATSASQCTGGTLVNAWAGHANANPAINCYLTSMNGPPDGTGSVLAFNPTNCYGSSSGPVFTPNPLAFGNQNVGTTSSALTLTLTNNAASSMTATQVATSGPFTQSGGTCLAGGLPFTLSAGASCTFLVTFSPSTTGALTGALSVTDNLAGSPHSATLTGTGVAPIATWTPTTYAFGNVGVGLTANSSNLQLSNTGTAPLNVSLSIGGANPAFFTVFSSTCPGSLAAGANCNVIIQFAPLSVTSYAATLTETDTPNSVTASLTLTGSGVSGAPIQTAPWVPIFMALPVPPQPVTPSGTMSPAQSYVSAQGCSQTGITWGPCVVTFNCSNCSQATLVTFDGVPVTQSYLSGVISVTIPLNMLPVPSVATAHKFSLSNPMNPVPVVR